MAKTFKSFFKIARYQLFVAFMAIIGFLAIVPVFTYIYFIQDLESKESIMNRNNTGIILLDKNKQPFFTFNEASNKTYLPISEIPDHMQQAVISVEDKEFYKHEGFSIKALLGALIADIKKQELAYGGSTITQQLVKNSLLSSQKSFLRKYQEIVLAQEVERRYSKDEILEMYLNSVYFGEGAFGVEEASKRYFGKPVKEISVAESALLASLLPSPTALSPLNGSKESALERQKFVLDNMQEQGYLTSEQKQQAKEQRLVFKEVDDSNLNKMGVHFALLVKEELIKRYGEEYVSRSGFRVTTTLDLEWQKYAESTVAQQVEVLKRNRVSNGSAVVIDAQTGEIRVLVGSKNWQDGQFGKVNVAISDRQPGSSFKPIIYSLALEKRIITPSTILKDQPTTFKTDGGPDYKPKNYDGTFRGNVLPRRALANSLNIPSVEIMSKVGVTQALEYTNNLGLTTLKDPSQYGLSLVLGAGEVKLLELTNVYATFANQGRKNEPTLISEIEDKYGETIYQYQPKNEQVLSEETAFIISSFLSDNRARQEVFGNSLTVSRPAAVKTGTTEDYRDAWTMGFTPDIAVGVWVGNNDGKQMDQVAGSMGAAPIWKLLIEKFSIGTPVKQFTMPSGVSSVTVCSNNGGRVSEATSSGYSEFYIRGTEPTIVCVIPKPTPKPEENKPSPTSNQNSPKPEENQKNQNPGGQPVRFEEKKDNKTMIREGVGVLISYNQEQYANYYY